MYEENEEKTAKLSKTSKIVFSVLGAAIVIALSIPVIYYILAGIYDILSPIVTYVISTFSYIFIRPFNVPRGELGAWGNYYMYCKWFIPACMVWLITWRIHWFFRVPGIIFSSSILFIGLVAEPIGAVVHFLVDCVILSWWVSPHLIWFTAPIAVLILYALS